MQVLLAAREAMTGELTAAVNALTALLRTHTLGIDARKALTSAKRRRGEVAKWRSGEVAKWRERDEELAIRVARAEAVRLAERSLELEGQLKANMTQTSDMVAVSEAAPLLDEIGFGPVTAAVALTTWSHRGRVRSEAAFASIAGVNPIPATSGNTVRHRLNRGGDRRLNSALHMVTITRMIHHDETRAYVEKRTRQGKSLREIRWCRKRYLARMIYRVLNCATPSPLAA